MSEAADAETRYRLDDLTIDLARQRVQRGAEPLNVAGLSFQLLRYLIAQGDRVVGFDELIERVWAPAIVNEETVTQRVKLLRQALGDDGRRPRYLRSVRGQGYQLCMCPQAIRDEDSPKTTGDAPAAPPWRAMRLAFVLAGVAALAVLAWLALRNHDGGTAPAAGARDSTLARAAYYAGIGQRDNNERAIELYQRALREQPGQVDALLGLSRAFSARVCLYNFAPQWAGRAERLARQAIEAQPRNAAAYSALGYAHDCRGRIDDALAGYERAVQLDPGADNSRASAAYLYDRKGRLADALVANTSLRGDPARVRFLQLQIAGNLDLLGYPQAAEARYRRSFELYPDNVFSNIAWPRFLFRQGRFSEAEAALAEAGGRGTEHVDLPLLAAELALLRGDRAAAIAAWKEAAALRPQASLPATLVQAGLGAAAPDRATARADELAALLAGGAGYPADWLEVALLRQAAGDRPAALAAVRRAVDAGYSDAAYLQTSPLFKSLAADPAFAASVDAINRRIVAERGKLPPGLLERLTASP